MFVQSPWLNFVLNKLQGVQNAAVRLIFGASARDHITLLRRELHWLQLDKKIEFNVVLYLSCLVIPIYTLITSELHPSK